MSFTNTLTSWVESPNRDPLDGYEVRYGAAESEAGATHLVVQKRARFFEVLMRDTGEGEFFAGIRGHFTARCCFRLDDESGLEDILSWLVSEVRSWTSFTWDGPEESPGSVFATVREPAASS